jgi:subtilisin family serine protease
VAAALLAACGGGGGNSPASGAATPQGVTITPQAASQASPQVTAQTAAQDTQASSDVVSLPVDSDRKAPPGQARKNNAYIVQLAEAPVATYTGGVQGLQATKPRKGQKIDPNSPAVVNYMAHLTTTHDSLLRGVGAANKLYSYGYVFNGFAAELTDDQAQKLAAAKGVLAVTKDEVRTVDTASTPAFLGLSGPNGFWATTGAQGEDVIIGMVDSGIWPESDSFSDRTGTNGSGNQGDKLDYHQLPGWNGKCTPGDAFTGANCNQKLIGARYYNAGWGGNAGITQLFPYEYNSPRDWGGHGTHTSSTAGGNSGVTITGPAAPFGKASGMAPRARIATYKVCWSTTELGGGCFNSDSVAAIDQAVADGVDVINFSIGGTKTNFRDPVEIAFMNAADAGVFVAASAGNDGPTASTVAHPSPWLTTVAAGTHNRSTTATLTQGNGAVFTGASLSPAQVSAPMIDATAAGAAGADPTMVRLCFAAVDNGGVAVLDPAKVAGKIVVCDRGVTARVNKSRAVAEAGGVGMVLVNTSPNTLNADYHSVPTVHLADTDRAAVKAYVAAANPSGTISKAMINLDVPAPFTASFSSRGPALAAGGNVLKPDIIAPGQDIIAAVAPPGNSGRSFDLYSGTSMSSPHIAGIAALFKQLHPDWSPMMIKSALMTTATDVLDGPNTNPLVIFRQGAGHVKPMAAADPGLVFDSNMADWLGFLCGTGLPVSFCTSAGVPVINPVNMNVASIALGNVAGVQTVTRRVTNVGKTNATYTPSVSGMSGFNVSVNPASLSIAPGQTKSFTVTFTRTSAPLLAYAGGQLTLSDGTHNVRVPMVARPVALGAPAEANGSYTVNFGYDGPFTATPRGLVAATKSPGSVATNGSVDFNIVVPSGTTYARFSLFDADINLPGTDLDLEVYYNGSLVGSSGGPTAQEEVNFSNPPAGTYTVRVIGFAVPATSANFNLYSWALGSTSAGNMTVSAPAAATTGGTGTISIATSGLAAGTKYLGSVVYGGTSNLPAPTIVRIDP